MKRITMMSDAERVVSTHVRPWIRNTVVASALLLGVTTPPPADAGARIRCRRACKPAIATCVSATGQTKRACKKSMLRQCRLEGLRACDAGGAVTTTTPPSSAGGPTTTTLPAAPGKLDFNVKYIERDASTDPGRYGFRVSVSGDAESLPVSLDPSAFFVLDHQEQRYEANPAAAQGDCTAADVAGPDAPVTCWVHFTLPVVVGFDEPAGEGYGRLVLEVGGYRRTVSFKVHAGGGWVTIR